MPFFSLVRSFILLSKYTKPNSDSSSNHTGYNIVSNLFFATISYNTFKVMFTLISSGLLKLYKFFTRSK